MRAARKRLWYLASILLALTAIGFDVAAKSAANVGLVGMAKATVARHDGVSTDVLETMHQQAKAAASRAGTLGLFGFCLAAAAGFCLIVSMSNHEARWYSIPLVILLAYVLSFLVMV
jgi:hypothetical protein